MADNGLFVVVRAAIESLRYVQNKRSLRNIVYVYFNVEIQIRDMSQALLLCYFNVGIRICGYLFQRLFISVSNAVPWPSKVQIEIEIEIEMSLDIHVCVCIYIYTHTYIHMLWWRVQRFRV